MKTIRIWFDGGSLGNPGKGYGSYEVDGGTDLKHKALKQQFGDNLTNNQAEYLSLLAALKWLRHRTDGQDVRLLVYSDSKLLVMQVIGVWKARVSHIVELRDEVQDMLVCYTQSEVHWQPRSHNLARFGH